MKMNRKFLVKFILMIIIMFIFNIYEVDAAGEIITYNGITTTMPDILEFSEDDPEAVNSGNKVDSSLLFVQTLGTTWGMQVPVDDLIERFEDEKAYVGIDVSKWQGDIDWKKVKESGVKYVMIRCGYRGYGSNGTLVKDSYFDTYIEGALENDLYVGVYFFSSAITEAEAIQEAEFVLNVCEEYDITYPIAYDFEYFGDMFDETSGNPYRTNGLTTEQINKNAQAFLGYIRSNSNYKTMLYGSSHYLNSVWNVSKYVVEDDIWLANYPTTLTSNKSTYTGDHQMWQCTDAGVVPGINTLVDMNFDYAYYQYLEGQRSFVDVNEDMWVFEHAEYCKDKGIILGYGETREYFKPYQKITRGMIVTILYRMAGSPEFDETQSMVFSDVNPDEYYGQAVKWASSVGVVEGYVDGTFRPNKSIIRQDLAIMIQNYAEIVLEKDISTKDEKVLLEFNDYFNVTEYAFEAVIWAVENKVITGKEEKDGVYIDPLGTATRAEAAAMFHKYLINSDINE